MASQERHAAPQASPAASRLIADRAYFVLRDRIVTLGLPPGAVLREDELMRDLAIGRTPLREAIKRLALEKLVAIQPRRGTRVTDVNVADIAHVTEVRAELEGQAAELAAARMDGRTRGAAEELITELARTSDDSSEALMRVDERVHRLTWEAAGNPYLAETLEGYFALSLRVWHLVLDRVELTAPVHGQVDFLGALLAGDGVRARRLMHDHVLDFQREIVTALRR